MALKMTKEHQDYIKESIEFWVRSYGGWQEIIELYETGQFYGSERVANLQMRFTLDLFDAAVPASWVCNNLYPYLNDGNIYHAIKKMVPTLNDRRNR